MDQLMSWMRCVWCNGRGFGIICWILAGTFFNPSNIIQKAWVRECSKRSDGPTWSGYRHQQDWIAIKPPPPPPPLGEGWWTKLTRQQNYINTRKGVPSKHKCWVRRDWEGQWGMGNLMIPCWTMSFTCFSAPVKPRMEEAMPDIGGPP